MMYDLTKNLLNPTVTSPLSMLSCVHNHRNMKSVFQTNQHLSIFRSSLNRTKSRVPLRQHLPQPHLHQLPHRARPALLQLR